MGGAILGSHASGYPPESKESQEKRADLIAWCDVVSITLNEKPRHEFGLSSQLRTFTFRIAEVVKGELPDQKEFSLRYAEYELLRTNELKYLASPEILVWEIHRRPRIEVGKQYKVFFRVRNDAIEPLNGRWSILETRVDPDLFEDWTGKSEEPSDTATETQE